MADFFIDQAVWFALVSGIIAVLYGGFLTMRLLKMPQGDKKMVDIAEAIQEGANAYMKRQYSTIAVVAVIVAALIWIVGDVWDIDGLGWATALGFMIGGILSAVAGIVGMSVSVRANVRTAEASKNGIGPGLNVAFSGGAVTGLLVAGLALVGVAGYYGLLVEGLDFTESEAVFALVGLSFGGSLISIFARLGGGIFTKGADVGGDLVGKIESGLDEDDPRNPAAIADNVGDNVGDCAGMAADLFETYAVTAVAVMLLGVLIMDASALAVVIALPLVVGGISVLTSIVGTFFVRTDKKDGVMGALYRGVGVTGILSAIILWPVIKAMIGDDGIMMNAETTFSWGEIYGASLVGLIVTGLITFITEYYTGTRWNPVLSIAKASETGHGTNIIAGLAVGMRATVWPVIVIVLGILVAHYFAGLFGIGVAVMAMLSMAGMIVALDAFGPITDNAGGIAEGAGLDPDVRKTTDALDAVGNTTKAVTKGYAIGSAGLAALVLFGSYTLDLEEKAGLEIVFMLSDPQVIAGLLIGGMMPFLFAAMSMDSVGRAGSAVVEEVRRQFKEKPGILDGTERPEYGRCVDIVTRVAIKEMGKPALIPIVIPIIVGILSIQALGGLLIGTIVTGLFLAISMTSGGGAWDNAKKVIEDGAHGGKNSEAHHASITGDTVGDPYKDTAGPAINPMIKITNIVALLMVPLYAKWEDLGHYIEEWLPYL